MNNQNVSLGNINFSNSSSLVLIAGINVIEDREFALESAAFIKNICEDLQIPLVFKASYDKANRSSIDSFRGPGIKEGLKILNEIQNDLSIKVLTDVHTSEEAIEAGDICDVIQLPAFLARQTDLVEAMSKTKAVINIKKPQFISPSQMKNIVDKFFSFGKENILICERGTNFGYDNLVVDMLGFGVIKRTCYDLPLIFDVTHSLQCRENSGKASGGRRSQCLELAKSAIALGISGLFIETHPNPENAKCDGPSALPLFLLQPFLEQIIELDKVVKSQKKLEIR